MPEIAFIGNYFSAKVFLEQTPGAVVALIEDHDIGGEKLSKWPVNFVSPQLIKYGQFLAFFKLNEHMEMIWQEAKGINMACWCEVFCHPFCEEVVVVLISK